MLFNLMSSSECFGFFLKKKKELIQLNKQCITWKGENVTLGSSADLDGCAGSDVPPVQANKLTHSGNIN